MSHHLNKAERQYILREMIELTRFLTIKGVALPTIKDAVKQLRDDLVHAYRQGIMTITVERNLYFEPFNNEHPKEQPYERSLQPPGNRDAD